ncbi:MAG: hypothetical protein ACRC7O_00270, partial [Fimbriiglobus sp.]
MFTADRQRDALRNRQTVWLRTVLAAAYGNRFYAAKFAASGLTPPVLAGFTVGDVARLPFTTKADLAADQAEHPPYGSGLTLPPAAYARMHQTSGTSTGRPLRWFDTRETWDRMLDCWDLYLRAWFGLTPGRDVL